MSQLKNSQRAAALKYENQDTGGAPVVVASGLGYMAEKIVEIAEENHVPVYQDSSLANLLAQLDAGAQIPQELYQAVVEIYVYFLNFTLKKEQETKEDAKVPEEPADIKDR